MNLPMNLNYFDIVLLALMAFFCVRGAMRGFVDEVAGLLGLGVGIYAAGLFYVPLGERMAPAFRDASWAFVLAYIVILIAGMLVVALLARLVQKVLKVAYADWLNHLAGAAAGLLKGLLACVVLVAVLDFFLSGAEFASSSRVAPVVREITVYIKGAVPERLYTPAIPKSSI